MEDVDDLEISLNILCPAPLQGNFDTTHVRKNNSRHFFHHCVCLIESKFESLLHSGEFGVSSGGLWRMLMIWKSV